MATTFGIASLANTPPYPVTDDAPAIQAAILAATTSYTLPSVVNCLSSIRLDSVSNLTINAHAGGTVITGSIAVTPRLLVSTDPRYSEVPSAVRSNTYVFSIPVSAGTPMGYYQNQAGGYSSVSIAPHVVYVNGTPMAETQWPSSGWSRITAQSGTSSLTNSAMPSFSPFNYMGANKVRVEGFLYQAEYGDYYGPATLSGTTATLLSPGTEFQSGNINANSRMRLRNVLELLTTNTCYVDLESRLCYFVFASTPTNVRISCATGPAFTIGNSCSVITFGSGIEISQRRGSGVVHDQSVTGAITYDGVTFKDIGMRAIDALVRTDNLTVKNAAFQRIGASGILCTTGTRRTLTNGNLVIQDTSFDQCGNRTLTYCGGIRMGGCGITAQRLTFTNHPGQAILTQSRYYDFDQYGINEALIDTISLTDICTDQGDAGAIYGGRDPNSWGVNISNITGLNVNNKIGTTDMIQLVYADDVLCGWTVTTVNNTNGDGSAIIGGGRNVAVRAVTSTNCTRQPVSMDNRATTNNTWTNVAYDGNLGMYTYARALSGDPFAVKYGAQYIAIGVLTAGQKAVPENCQVRSVTASGTTPAQTNYATSFGTTVNVAPYP